MKYVDEILELVLTHPFYMKFNKWVFGKRYKAYYDEDNKMYELCDCEINSIITRTKLYEIYKSEFLDSHHLYRDITTGKELEVLTLKDFLGLPEEMEVDYEKEIIPQLRFTNCACHRCCGFDYKWEIPVYNPENKKSLIGKVKDVKRDIEKENLFLSKGIHYVPILKTSYIVVDFLDEWQKEILKPTLSDFQIQDKWCVGAGKFIDNKDIDKQVNEIKKFLKLPLDTQLKFIYRNYSIEERNEIANKFDKRYLCLTNTYTSEYTRAVHLSDIKNIDKKVREMQSAYLKDFPITTEPTELVRKLYYETINEDWSKEDIEDVRFMLYAYMYRNAPVDIMCENINGRCDEDDEYYDEVNALQELAIKVGDDELLRRVNKRLTNE